MKVWFFSKRLGLIAWLCEFRSRRIPSSRSASSLKVEETMVLFLFTYSMSRRGFYRSSWHLKPISLDKDPLQVVKLKKMALRRHTYSLSPPWKLPIPPFPIKILHEWQWRSMHIIQHSVQFKISTNLFRDSLSKVGMIPCQTKCMIPCEIASWPGNVGRSRHSPMCI